MNNTLSNIVIFTAGAIIGSVVTWKLVKTKYEQIAQEEIDEVREFYAKKVDKLTHEEKSEDAAEVKSNVAKEEYAEYANVINGLNYANITKEEVNKMGKPYVITPEEYGDLDDYDLVSLTYYADGYLTDEQDNLIEDVDNVVGVDSLTHFGEYEDDSVFVRNDSCTTDYEILLDERNYLDVINRNPHLAEDE